MPTGMFTYAVTRPISYRWFPWAVIIGGSLAAALISVFSLASNGYYLELVYIRNLNETLGQQQWYDWAPFSWVDHITPKCQAMELQVGTRIFTDKRIREYEVTSLHYASSEVLGLQTPVIMYSNNILEDCKVNFIVMHLYDQMTSDQYYAHGVQIPISLDAKAYLTCTLQTPNPTTMTMTVDLLSAMKTFGADQGSPIPAENMTVDQSISATDVEVHQAMATFIIGLYMVIMASKQNPLSPEIPPGVYTFARNLMSNDIDSPDFFLGDRFTSQDASNADFFLGYNYNSSESTGRFKDIEQLNVNFTLPSHIDRLTKLFYSSILADVGRVESNIVNNRTQLVDWASAAFSELSQVNEPAFEVFSNLVRPWLNRTTETTMEDDFSTIYTQYQCQVPTMKPVTTLIMSVFLADLVFLQALWKILNWVTVYRLQSSDVEAMCCDGCVKRYQNINGGPGGSQRAYEIYAQKESTISTRSLLLEE